MDQQQKTSRKPTRFFVGQAVWALYENFPWRPAYVSFHIVLHIKLQMCDRDEPLDVSIPSGCYVIKFASGSHGFAAAHNLKPLNEMSLKTILNMDISNTFKKQIISEYEHVTTNNQLTNKVATTRPRLMVNIYKKTKGKEEQIEVVACVKKRKLNTDEEMDESEDEDQIMTDYIPERFIDMNELMNILQVYNNKGFLGILESFGMTFANLKFSTDQLDLADKSSIAYQIYHCNSTMEAGLMQYLRNFLTTFSIQFTKDFKYHNPEADYLQFLERQFEEAKNMAEKLNRLPPEAQLILLRTATPSLFLPLFKIKNMIDNEAHMVEMTYQEYFIKVFKRLHIFSHAKKQGIVFKTSEPLESKNLKLSLNIMNKKWIENTNRMQPDFTLMRYWKEHIHYFIIGEFANCDIKASNAEEFLCSHKDTIKILLEGRSVLKDIATSTTKAKVQAKIREELVVTLFLADTSGKMVILKMRPIFHEISIIESLIGVYYEFSYSRLLNLFDMKDACVIMSEIDNCVEMACKFSYDIDETATTTDLCTTPMTLKSKSEIAKLISIRVEQGDVSLRFFQPDDEIKLFKKLAEDFPRLSIRKTERVVTLSEIDAIPIRFTVSPSGEITMYGPRTMTVCGNPIEACYPILDMSKYDTRFKIILLESDKKVEIDNSKKPQDGQSDDDYNDDKQDFNQLLLPRTPTKTKQSDQRTDSPHTPQRSTKGEEFKKQIQEITFKRWGLMDIVHQKIHSRTISSTFGDLASYICYCEGKLSSTTSVFVKIHSGHEMETYNENFISKYVAERIQADCSNATHTIKVYKYFIEDVSVPYEIFGDITTPCKGYRTDVTISELLTPVEDSKLAEVQQLNDKTKLLTLLYVMDGGLRGIHYMVNTLQLLHHDIAFRNVMVRNNSNNHYISIISSLLEQHCNFVFTDDIVVTDINNCKKYYDFDLEEFQNEMKCLAEVFIKFVSFLFGKQANQELLSIHWKNHSYDGDFKLVHTWIVSTIELLLGIRKSAMITPQFENENFQKAVEPLNKIINSFYK